MTKTTKPKSVATQPRKTPPFPRNLPMYFKGEQQSAEFACGAWALRDALAQLYGYDTANFSHEDITAALADRFTDHGSKGDEYSLGFATAALEVLAMAHCVGLPAIDVWRPLRMEWCGGVEEQRIERAEAFLERVQKHGRVLTQQEFDAMWARVAPVSGEAPPTDAPEIGFEDTVMLPTPIDIVGHPAHDRISCATLAVHQLVVLTDELVDHISVEPGDERAFVAMALASRAHRLAHAANRLLSLPAKEIDFEACEAEVCLG